MRTLLVLSAISFLFSSCTREIYQITTLDYVGENPGITENATSHQDLNLTYDFWRPDGMMNVSIENLSDETMIIDLSRSSIIIGGQSFPYGENQYQSNNMGRFAKVIDPMGVIGTVNAETRSPQVGIPANTVTDLSRMMLPVPLQTTRTTRPTPNVRINPDFPEDSLILIHQLCYYPDGESDQPRYLRDEFKIQGMTFLNGIQFVTKFDQYEAGDKLTSYTGIQFTATQDQQVVGTAAIIIGTALLTVWAATLEEE